MTRKNKANRDMRRLSDALRHVAEKKKTRVDMIILDNS